MSRENIKCHFILYVADQQASTRFYTAVFDRSPDLNLNGMTEFHLGPDTVLGLMPAKGIRKLLGDALPEFANGRPVLGAEIYLKVIGARAFHERAIRNGARELSPPQARDWGDVVAYSLDTDGHVLAFAESISV